MNLFATILMAFLAGIGISTQATFSGQLSLILRSPHWAALVLYVSSSFFMLLYIVVSRKAVPSVAIIQLVPIHLWFAGSILSCLSLTAVYWLIPRAGVAPIITGVILGQLLFSSLFSHFGLFDLPQTPFGLQKVFGILCIFAGVMLVNKG